jgi:hypothetical protein
MRQVTRKSLITVAAAGGVLALAGSGVAYADAGAQGAAEGSPGVLSGNNVQVPVHVPVNVCGNSVNVVGLLNPAFGNKCVNAGGSHADAKKDHKKDHTTAGGEGGSSAQGAAVGSPGVGSGNNIQIPVDVPVNACGNTVNVISALNPTFGNHCGNHANPSTPEKHHPHHPGTPDEPNTPDSPKTPDEPGHHKTPEQPNTPTTQTVAHPQLAETGTDVSELGVGAALSAGLLLGGVVLYRRGRAVRQG